MPIRLFFSKTSYPCFTLLVSSHHFLTLYLQQKNLFKAREEKYQSRIKVLEALASGTKEDSEVSQIVIIF